MTFNEYKQTIDQWTLRVEAAGVRMSNGKPLPTTFWKTFLGLKRKVHQDMYMGKHRTRTGEVMPYVECSIRFAQLLDDATFLDEVRACIPLFEQDKAS